MDNLSPILQRIPQFNEVKSLEIQELTGGITNKNYKINADGECFVLRLGGNETQFLGIDRKTEYQCSLLASQIGIAPEPIAFLEPEGYIVARFISGKAIPVDEIGTEENITGVVRSLQACHGLDFFPGTFSPFRVAEEYAETARRFHVMLPAKLDGYLEKSNEIEKALYRQTLQMHPCHNDLLNGNFIDDGTRIRILDWEYAGMGDIFFDLGNFAVQHDFDDELDELLLKTYFREPTDEQRAHQKLMKIMSDLREAMWAQVQRGVSRLDFDYQGYGQKYFDRFEANTMGTDYSEWLRAVESS
jgi:thiamine kinase-like enzyme